MCFKSLRKPCTSRCWCSAHRKKVNFSLISWEGLLPGVPRPLPTRSGRDDAEAASARPLQGDTFWLSLATEEAAASFLAEFPRPRRLPPGTLVLHPRGPASPAPGQAGTSLGEGGKRGSGGSRCLGGLAELNLLKLFKT